MKLSFALLTLCATTLSAAPCDTAAHRQFDFWVGEWTVTSPDGQTAGTNKITKIAGDCALLEEWRGKGGVTGKSLNIYDASRKVWHQTWVDNSGSLLLIEGKFENGSMRMAARGQRITWTPLPGGEVRQVWEQSTDGDKTWTVAFDGKYSRMK